MITLRNLYTAFGHDPKWGRLATQSAQPMVSVFMRKLGDTDITTLTDFDIEMQLAMSEQPEDRKVKARSCMHYLLRWAREQGKEVPQIAHPNEIKARETEEPPTEKPVVSKPQTESKTKAKRTETKERKKQCRKKSTKKVADNHHEHADALQDYNDGENINIFDSEHTQGKPSTGTIYHDNASKGWKNGKRVFKDCWRAEIMIAGQRFRHRSKEREDCERWLKAVRTGKIMPTDNKADWWRMEQRKDDIARFDEIIVSAAEESVMLYDYHQTGDLSAINDYLEKRLLPHMAYYCAHTLQFGRDRTITASRQAAALLLTRITAGKPVMNFTATCKRMLRVNKRRGDFFYYEKAPIQVKLLINGMNIDGLADVWKVAKDRRI